MVFLISTACLFAAPLVAAAATETVIVTSASTTIITAGSSAAGSAAGTAAALAQAGAFAGEVATATTVTGGSVIQAIVGAATGPVGWFVLGAEVDYHCTKEGVPVATFDCWKPIVRETDPSPSKGVILNDLLKHPHIASFCAEQMVITNIWGERFRIAQVMVPTDTEISYPALHAVQE